MKKIKSKKVERSREQTKNKGFKFFVLILFVFAGGKSFAQPINDPGTNPEVDYSNPLTDGIHDGLEGTHASPKVQFISATEAPDSFTEFWPAGTWRKGYLNTYSNGYTDWYLNKYSNHPLIRESSRFTLGYIHASRSLSTSVNSLEYTQRAIDGIIYLMNAQRADGGFTWWRYRPGLTYPNTNEVAAGGTYSIDNTYSMFTIGYALKALAEGHWFVKCHLGLPAEDIEDAVKLTADYVIEHLEEVTGDEGTNANERGLVAWGLSTAYKATGNVAYKDAALELTALIMDAQYPEGDWATDGGNDTPIDAIPLGGPKPLQDWIAGDFNGDGNDELLQKYTESKKIYLYHDNFEFGTNNLYSGTKVLEKWLVGNFDGDAADEVLHKFVGSPYIYVWNYGDNFGVNSVYTGGAHLENWICGDFDDDGVDEVLQKYSGSNTIYLWGNGDSFGSNSIYTGGSTLENWLVGNFDADDNIEVLQKYTGTTTVYLWNDGATFGANAIYTGPKHIENWIASDFDNDGKDEVLQKYVGSTYIYLWDEAYAFETNSVYTGAHHIEKWQAGDFDGDGKDEVIQKYVGSSYIYEWNYGLAFNESKPYEGPDETVKWIVFNAGGVSGDQLFQIFDDSHKIYYWEDSEPTRCMGCYEFFNIPEVFYRHDSRTQYHFFILGALIETYSIATGSQKNTIASSIKKATNHVIARLDPAGTNRMSNFYFDEDRNLVPYFIREKNMFTSREAIQQFPQLAYYAGSDPGNFSPTDIDHIINLGNRMVNPDLPGYSYYKDYMNAINDDTYLDYYGGCAQGVFLPEVDRPYDEHVEDRGMMNEPEGKTTFLQNLYPNPVKDIVNISDSKGFVRAEIYSSMGMLIDTHYSTQLNLVDLASGMYLLKIYRKSSDSSVQDDLEVQTEIIVKE